MSKTATFESNPITVLMAGLKNVFNYTQTMAIILLLAPFGISIINTLVQVISEAFLSTLDDKSTASGTTIAIGLILFLGALCLLVYLQIILTAMGWLTGLRSAAGKNLTFQEAFNEAMSKFWKLVWISAWVFTYSLLYVCLAIGVLFAAIILGIQDKSTLGLVVPVAGISLVILFVLIVRVYTRYALAPFALFDGQSVKEALATSKRLTKDRLLEIFNVSFIGSLIPIVNLVLVAGGLGHTYEQRKVVKDTSKLPPVSKSNYYALAIVCMLGLIFIALIASILAFASMSN